jgi:hypothetical protein
MDTAVPERDTISIDSPEPGAPSSRSTPMMVWPVTTPW